MNPVPVIILPTAGELLNNSEKITENTVETALCALNPKHFASEYAWIQNQNTKKIEKWKPWGYLLTLIDIIQEYDLIYIVKASQVGVSWLIAIYNLWLATFNETTKCLLLSQGQSEAYDLLSKVGFLHSRLPDFLKLKIANSNREFMSFMGNYAEIRALPSTEKAGHGYQATIVTRDELARHEYARENFRAVSRAVDSGGKMIELSTANKSDPTNYFQEKTGEFFYHPETVKEVLPSGVELFTNPKRPKTCLVFISWKLRPTRYEGLSLDEWFKSRIIPKYTPIEIEEQYPTVIEDVFKASIVKSYFDYQSLEDMGYDVCPPIKQSEVDIFNNLVRVYKVPVTGRKYVVFTDPSDGVEDPFVTGVMDYITGEVVASGTGMVKVDFVAKIHDYLVRAYNNAPNSYEYTGSAGGSMQTTLGNLNTPSQAPRRKADGKIDIEKKGQWVSAEHKRAMFGDLAFAITKRQFVIHDREFMQQAKTVTRDDNGNPVTGRKMSFDWVMMMTGLWQLQKFAPRTGFKLRTIDLED